MNTIQNKISTANIQQLIQLDQLASVTQVAPSGRDTVTREQPEAKAFNNQSRLSEKSVETLGQGSTYKTFDDGSTRLIVGGEAAKSRVSFEKEVNALIDSGKRVDFVDFSDAKLPISFGWTDPSSRNVSVIFADESRMSEGLILDCLQPILGKDVVIKMGTDTFIGRPTPRTVLDNIPQELTNTRDSRPF